MSVDEAQKNAAGFENKASMSPKTAAAASASVEESLESRCRSLEEETQTLRESEESLKQQNADYQRRERLLVRRLASKEQEMQDYVLQISEYKAAQAPTAAALRNSLLDPAINVLFQKLKQELQATKAKLEETQNELSAWKFTPDSNTGKRLMAKCRLLYQENEELGKMTSNGRLAKLEASLASHKTLYEEVKKSQSELDDFLQEIDEDVEGMQSTILFLQQELKSVREQNEQLRTENDSLKHVSTNGSEPAALTNGSLSVECGSVQNEQRRTQSVVANGDENEKKIDASNGDETEGGLKRALDNATEIQSEPIKRTRRAVAAATLDTVASKKLVISNVESANSVV